MPREFDVVLMGATSFVGKITARRFIALLHEDASAFRFALAARSKTKLEQLVKKLNQEFPAIEIPFQVADSLNTKDMVALATSTRVVASAVGPYDLLGAPLVKACAEQGTHYCDLTGEPQFIHRMLATYEKQAASSGACLVHCCGFDSIPSDIGTYFLQKQSVEQFSQPCLEVDMRLQAASGSFSGGTVASLVNVIRQVANKPGLKKVLFDPYALSPEKRKVQQTFISKAQPDWVTDQWVAPFVMAGINSKIVMRTSQLSTSLYPDNFRYNEGMLAGRGKRGKYMAKLISAGLSAITVSAAMAPTRWILEKVVLPKPGQGPSEKKQEEGFFVVQIFGKTQSNDKLAVQVSADQDPGYGSTSKMLSQAALALAFDVPENQKGGFWTPASLLGEPLLERLPEKAGVEFKRLEL